MTAVDTKMVDDSIDSVIAALEAEVEDTETVMVSEIEDDSVIEAAVASAEVEEMAAEVEAETAVMTSDDMSDATPPTAATESEKKAKVTRPRVHHSTPGDALLAITSDPGNFAFSVSDDPSEKARDEFIAKLNDRKTTAKKVAEKVINFYHSTFGSAHLSNYTQIAVDALRAKKELTSAELIALYEARPYSKGTARAQSSQMMQLLPMLGIAKRDGKKLVLNDESTFNAIASAE